MHSVITVSRLIDSATRGMANPSGELSEGSICNRRDAPTFPVEAPVI